MTTRLTKIQTFLPPKVVEKIKKKKGGETIDLTIDIDGPCKKCYLDGKLVETIDRGDMYNPHVNVSGFIHN